jgi:hypothetical protein
MDRALEAGDLLLDGLHRGLQGLFLDFVFKTFQVIPPVSTVF